MNLQNSRFWYACKAWGLEGFEFILNVTSAELVSLTGPGSRISLS